MKRINIIKSIFFVGTIALGVGCTNLDEEVLDGYVNSAEEGGAINTAAILQSSYEGLRGFETQGQMFALDEMSTDALVGPTRGGDWDDNATWRQIHVHTWAPDHNEVRNAWNALLSNVPSFVTTFPRMPVPVISVGLHEDRFPIMGSNSRRLPAESLFLKGFIIH